MSEKNDVGKEADGKTSMENEGKTEKEYEGVSETSAEDGFFNSERPMSDYRDNGNGSEDSTYMLDKDSAAELEKVMKPGKGRARHPIMAGMVILASLALLWLMTEDIAYFMQRGSPKKLGDASEAVEKGKLEDNIYAHIRTNPDINTWATVSRRGCTVGPKSAPKSFYSFYIVRDTNDRLIVRRSLDWKQRTEEQKRRTLELDVSGRLRAFNKMGDYYTKYRRFLAQTAKQKPAMHNHHEIRPEEIRKHAGKSKAVLTDTEERDVRMEPQMEVALYSAFKDELELSVMRGHKMRVDKVTFEGGKGPKMCSAPDHQRGRNVVLVKDRDTLDFGKLRDGITVTASGENGGTKTSGSADTGGDGAEKEDSSPTVSGLHSDDLIIKVPVTTEVYDFESGDLLAFEDNKLIVGKGGGCGGKAGESKTVNMEAVPFQSRRSAELFVSRFGFPFKLIDENPVAFEFIIKAPESEGKRLLKEQSRGDPYTVDFRTEWYICQWSELKLEDDSIVIQPARPSHPTEYRVVTNKGKGDKDKPEEADKAEDGEKTEPKKATSEGAQAGSARAGVSAGTLEQAKRGPGEPILLDLGRVRKVRVTTQRTLPKGAYILLSGDNPDDYWFYPLIALLLFFFILFNLWSIRNYFKYVRPAEKRSLES